MIYTNDSNFSKDVLLEGLPVLLEFFTPTCQPCRQMEPWLQKLEFDVAGRVKIVKIDSTKSPLATQFYGVRIAPTIMIFNGGDVLRTIRGKPPTPQHLYDLVAHYM